MKNVIQVGSVTIINHDNYWKCLSEVKKLEDKILRGLGQVSQKVDTPFSLSCKSQYSHSDFVYLNDLKEAIKIFEETYPKKNLIFGVGENPISYTQ
jgi:hypothetical protein